jgi:hypothetical protein
LAIAIVVDAIAGFGFGFGCGAFFPFALFALLEAFSTCRRTPLKQLFVDLTVAIIVFVVAGFGLGGWGRTG